MKVSFYEKLVGTVVPQIKLDKIEVVLNLVDLLWNNSFKAVSIPMKSSATLEMIRLMKKKHPKLSINVTNILTKQQVDDVIEAGATFISTVHVNQEIIEYCKVIDVKVVPECASAIDIEKAQTLGVQHVKLLSSTPLSEIKMVAQLAERYPHLKFFISEGIEADLYIDYLNLDCVVDIYDSSCYGDKLIVNEDYETIDELQKQLVKKLLGLNIAHVGVNPFEDEASSLSRDFATLLECGQRETPISYFIGESIEVMKQVGRGQRGHIGYRVNNMGFAMRYYISKGHKFIEDSYRYDESGNIIFAYFEQEIGGFAIHLVQK